MGGNAEAEPFVPCASGARSEMAGTFDTGAKGFFVPVQIEQKNLGGNDMIDLKFLRENPEVVKQNIKNKFQDHKLPLVDEVIELDAEARKTQQEADDLRAKRNQLSKEIGKLMGQGKKDEAEAVKTQVAEGAARLAELEENQKILTKLDFIFAKAKYAKEYQGTEPIFNTDGIVDIKQGRHPLLDPKKVVPIHIYIGEDFNMLLLTGPNTGGKTVSLKTVGLLTLMGLAGLHVPAAEGTTLSVFTEVYADIGDEQSIEQNLSTFSSHMTNTVKFLDKADKDSLVLFDELGAGTDPVEGAALAMAILSFLHNMKVRTMATTHYSELKLFALSTPGVENASCEFNVETLLSLIHI